jgi:hypothetical protein
VDSSIITKQPRNGLVRGLVSGKGLKEPTIWETYSESMKIETCRSRFRRIGVKFV